ncbi:unnamed protein product [Leptosia nina]|uniref:Uncharacterized protein n=1 Tax=Leptosia nina TaxID=320188 RepID=A0AAV1K043_9NEOP
MRRAARAGCGARVAAGAGTFSGGRGAPPHAARHVVRRDLLNPASWPARRLDRHGYIDMGIDTMPVPLPPQPLQQAHPPSRAVDRCFLEPPAPAHARYYSGIYFIPRDLLRHKTVTSAFK